MSPHHFGVSAAARRMPLGPLETVTTLLLGVAYHESARMQRIADDGEVDFAAG